MTCDALLRIVMFFVTFNLQLLLALCIFIKIDTKQQNKMFTMFMETVKWGS